jgi:ABC-type glutathione transport system ATPase component
MPVCLIFLVQGIVYFYLVQKLFKARWSGTSIFKIPERKRRTSHCELTDIELTPIMDAEVRQEIDRINSHPEEFILIVKGLKKEFPLPGNRGRLNVISDLWPGVRKNECMGFLGPNGAGKTSAIKILVGLDRATAGSAFISGLNVVPEFDSKVRKQIGFCSLS